MKKFLTLVVCLLVALCLASCVGTSDSTIDIACITDIGQLNDGGFNQGTYEGVKQYAEANGKKYAYFQPANGDNAQDEDRIAAMEQAIENGAKILVLPGYAQYDALLDVCTRYPEVKFVFIDGWTFGQSNVTAVSYKEEESGYFAGYAAVMAGYTKLAGTFGGGGTNAACSRFAIGYVQGINAAAAALSKTCDVTISFKYGAGFSASPELQTQVSGWYSAGTEVVFACGGSMLQSVKAAAAETADGKIIGVDVDQSGESERVITSAVKGLTESVVKILTQYFNGEWDTNLADKTSNLGAADDATGIPTAASSWRLGDFTVEQYQAIFNQVKNGEITISNVINENMSSGSVQEWQDIISACPNVNLTIEE